MQELFFCDRSICRTVYSNDLVKFFWLRCTARKKLGIYDYIPCYIGKGRIVENVGSVRTLSCHCPVKLLTQYQPCIIVCYSK